MDLTVNQIAALASGRVMRRMFIYFSAHSVGFWDDIGDVELNGRIYHGSGSVIQIGSVAAKGDMTIPGIQIILSGVDTTSVGLVRGEEIAQTPVEVSVGIFNPSTHAVIDSLVPIFTGFVDNCEIETPASGGDSSITFTCESTSRALTAARTSTRSHATEIERDPTDTFYLDTGAQRKPVYFGRKAPIDRVPRRTRDSSGGPLTRGRR